MGIRTPRELVAAGLDEALRAAHEIGYPLVASSWWRRTSSTNPISAAWVLGIKDEKRAPRRPMGRVGEKSLARGAAGARGSSRCWLAQQVFRRHRASCSASQRDPEIGPVLMFGTGGVLLQLSPDVSFGGRAALALAGQGDAGSAPAPARLLAGLSGARRGATPTVWLAGHDGARPARPRPSGDRDREHRHQFRFMAAAGPAQGCARARSMRWWCSGNSLERNRFRLNRDFALSCPTPDRMILSRKSLQLFAIML